MNLKRWLLALMILLLCAALVPVVGCGDDDDDDDDTGADDDDSADDDDDDDDTGDDDDDDDTGPTWEGSERVYVLIDGALIEVMLQGLSSFTWTDPEDSMDKQAVLVSTVVDAALASDKEDEIDPTAYKYNFINADDDSVLGQNLDGDFRTLPAYADLPKGWFVQYEENGYKYTDLRVIWDDSLNYEDYMKAIMMNGGTLEMVENILFDQDVAVTVSYMLKGLSAEVNLSGLPAFDDDGALAVPLHLIVREAALDSFDPETFDYFFDFISNNADGNWSLLEDGLGSNTGLLPVWQDYANDKDIHHGWIKNADPDGYKLFWDPATGFDGTYQVDQMDAGKIIVWVDI